MRVFIIRIFLGQLVFFSPSFWIARDIEKQISKQHSEFFENQRWYVYGGGLEGENMVQRVENIGKLLSAKLKCEVHIALCGKGHIQKVHGEKCSLHFTTG
jgi:hypothetical protein